MDSSLLDTDILSEVFKGRDSNVRARAAEYREYYGHYTTSMLTVLEIVKGFHKSRREDRIQAFLATLPSEEVLTLDLASAEMAGRIHADLELAGRPLGRIDPMIAAIAIRHGLTLVTGNEAHYEHVQQLGYSLKLDNWRRSGTHGGI